jgi:hypothetical protein
MVLQAHHEDLRGLVFSRSRVCAGRHLHAGPNLVSCFFCGVRELDRFCRFCYNINSTEDKSPIWFDYLEETRARR